MEPVLLDPRDPWTDPRVGDIFVRDNEARVVTGFAPGAPVIVIKNRRGSPRGHSFDTPECWDAWASWWAWASGARVIRAVRMGHFHEVDPYERDIPFYAIRPVKAKSGGMLPAAWESLAADCVEVEVIDAHLGRKWVLVCRNVVFPTNPKQIRKKL